MYLGNTSRSRTRLFPLYTPRHRWDCLPTNMLQPQRTSRLPYVHTVVFEIINDPGYSINLFLPTRTRENASEDVSPCRGHQSRLMHPAILPELGVIAGSLPVNDGCNLGAVDENIVRKEVTMSEVDVSAGKWLNSSSTYSGPQMSRKSHGSGRGTPWCS